jgi:hypothetical protein
VHHTELCRRAKLDGFFRGRSVDGEIHSILCAKHFIVCYHDRRKKAELLLFVRSVYCGMALKLPLSISRWSVSSPGAQDGHRR